VTTLRTEKERHWRTHMKNYKMILVIAFSILVLGAAFVTFVPKSTGEAVYFCKSLTVEEWNGMSDSEKIDMAQQESYKIGKVEPQCKVVRVIVKKSQDGKSIHVYIMCVKKGEDV
jgi:hypothetical protein